MTDSYRANMQVSRSRIEPEPTPGVRQVLIVEEDALARHGLAALLAAEADLEISAAVDDQASALQSARLVRPHMAIIDLALRKGSSMQLIRCLRRAVPEIEILVLSPYEDSMHVDHALRAGARGYMWKSEPAENIVAALRLLQSGTIYLSPKLAGRLLNRRVGNTPPEQVSRFEALSQREMEVFEMYGRGMKTSEIAEQLFLSPKTIATHRHRIKQKLQLRSMNQLVSTAAQFRAQPD